MNTKFIYASIFCLLFSTCILQAQTSKGNFLIGGTLGFSFSNTNVNTSQTGLDEQIGETTTVAVDFTPKIGYFLAKNFAAGVQFEYTTLSAKTENEKNVATKFLTGPFARYYIPLGGKKAFLLESNFGFGRTSVSEGSADVSTTLLGFGIGPGITIFSSDLIGIEALAKYNWQRGITEIGEARTTEKISEIDFVLGLQIYFSRLVRASN